MHPLTTGTKPRPAPWFSSLLWGLAGGGVFLRAVQYLPARSLWLDEILLALNLTERGFVGLFVRPLDYHQAAPPGFLLIAKTLLLLLGENEWVLRLPAFLASLIALFLFLRLVRDHFAPVVAIAALAIFAVSDPLIYYAAEVKPYAFDVAGTVILLTLTVRLLRNKPFSNRLAAGGMLAVLVLPWFSFPAMFTIPALWLVLFTHRLSHTAHGRRRERRGMLIAAAGFAVTAGLNWWLVLRPIAADTVLHTWWDYAYIPPPVSAAAFKYYWVSFGAMFHQAAGLFPPLTVLPAVLLGCAALFRRNRRVDAAIICLPILFTGIASGLHLYPFHSRLLIFLVPCLILLVAEGIGWLFTRNRRWRLLGILFIIGLSVNPLTIVMRHWREPRVVEDSRPVLASVRDHARPGDQVYLAGESSWAYRYYAPRIGLTLPSIIPSATAGDDWDAYTRDLNACHGRGRVWLFFSHVWDYSGINVENYCLAQARAQGQQLAEYHAPGSAAYLFSFVSQAGADRRK